MNKLPKMSGVPPVIVSALVEVEEWDVMSRAAVTTTNEPRCGASGVPGERNEPDWSYCCVVLRVPSLSPALQRTLQDTTNRSIFSGNGTEIEVLP